MREIAFIKQEIVEIALQHLPAELELRPYWHFIDESTGDKNTDGKLELMLNGKPEMFIVDIKNEIRNVHVKELIERKQMHELYILIARRLYPNIKSELREQGINYLEANGNLFIHTANAYLLVDTNKPFNQRKEVGNRAFTKTGLQVVFQLLKEPHIINLTQREIARRAGVALGNIPKIIDGLIKSNYLLRYDEKTFRFIRPAELLHKWALDYENTLRPTLEMGKFKLLGNRPWQELHINPENTYWGAEPAADIMTNYLRPEVLTIYTHLGRQDLIKNYRLMPEKNGNIEVLKAFWPQEKQPPYNRIVHPLLVYIDLINTNEKRNTETAQIIYDEHIKPNL